MPAREAGREGPVIRITRQTHGPPPVLLNVEGKIDAQGVQVLEQECLDGLTTAGACFPDFSGATFIDRRGRRHCSGPPANGCGSSGDLDRAVTGNSDGPLQPRPRMGCPL